ncbi:MAG: pteridine reductase [Steroidobacteraceae bacterium]|nr:pteridine reductase [Steroidobacteraceae bacterium]MDW8259343.1 pteridine reductase [Gammaproteobacteria bacterium]
MPPVPPTAPLDGKTALVTGGARRLGAAIVRALHAAGARIVVHYHRSADAAHALVAELNDERAGSAVMIGADLLDLTAHEALVRTAQQHFGSLDLLVNNASTFYPTPLGEITPAQWEDLIGTNLKAPLFLSQAAAPALRLARGLIVNLVDIHGVRPLRRYLTYSVAKAGLVMLTRALARELGPLVRVNGVAPGPVLWPTDAAADPALRAKIIDRTVLKRSGTPEDVARAVRFFACDAPYVTGQILTVDGGRSIGW